MSPGVTKPALLVAWIGGVSAVIAFGFLAAELFGIS
jgi:hypothetical protein